MIGSSVTRVGVIVARASCRLADAAPPAKLAAFDGNNTISEHRDEHGPSGIVFDIAETAAARRFPHVRLLPADKRADKSGAAKFSRWRLGCARSRRGYSAGESPNAAREDTHRRSSPLRSAGARRGENASQRTPAEMVGASFAGRHG